MELTKSFLFSVGVMLMVLLGQRLPAMPPPTPEMVRQYKADGTWKKRLERAERIGNHRVDPQLVLDAERRLRSLATSQGVQIPNQASILSAPPSSWRGMPTKGTPKMFVLLIDFSDYPADPANTAATIDSRIFGDGDGVQAAPYESLKSFYYRSSYGLLTLTGNVLAYYRPSYTRASMGTNPTDAQRENLIREALQAQVGHDFSHYDNNGDGVIDFFAVLWTGPDNGWANFWWAYQTAWSETPSPVLNGKTLGKYVWQWVSNAGYPTRKAPNFDPWVLIHETGHALGLPDYYDYDTAVGPGGGVGSLDMMHGNWGDHNCFSKWLLDWITPTVYTAGAPGVTLQASGSTPEAAVIMDTNPGGSFGEFFMVQNRQRVQNDNDPSREYPADGLLIWHVDSRLNSAGTDYQFDNSYTAHKLLRLMEADGLEEIETLSADVNAGDYWINGKTFGPASLPNSMRYDGASTGMGVKNISDPGATMTFDVSQIIDPTPPTGRPSAPVASTVQDTMTFTWNQGNAVDLDSGISGYHLQVGTSLGGCDIFNGRIFNALTKTLTDLGVQDGVPLYARVTVLNGLSMESAWSDSSAPLAIALPVFDRAVLDNANLTFTSLGPWTATTSTSHLGGSCARSAVIPNSSRTYLQTRVTGPGILTFYWKVNSELDYDFLTFNVDGKSANVDGGGLIGKISGTIDFAQQTFNIPAGSHLLRWTYAKDLASAPDNDGAWVDNVSWTTNTTATILPASTTALIGALLPFTATLSNFQSDNRVNWTISAGGGSFNAPQTASGVATTLTTSNTAGIYTLTATPVETPNVPGTATLTLVEPTTIALSVDHPTATLVYGAALALAGTTSNGTIRWSLSGPGSLSADSGLSNTYTAPPFANQLTDTSATVTLTNSLYPTKTATSVLTVKTLDVNGDAVFDLRDILTLALDWGTTTSRSRLNGDATVGEADLNLLLKSLGF